MAEQLLLATTDGLRIYQRDGAQDGGWREVRRSLDGQHITSVIVREGVILAGSRQGVQRSDDDGRSWRRINEGLSIPYVRWLAYHPEVSDFEVAGTEPAGIFVSHDGGETWRGRTEVAVLRDQHGWFLPYSPEAGCVRGFAFHGQRAYAAVEVGGVLRSDDNGATWALAAGSDGDPGLSGPPEPLIYPDLHSIHVHPSSADLVFAPTGGGFYRSRDGGATWQLLYDCYCRAVWVDPADPDHLVLGPADGVDSDARIEQTRDGGQSWTLASSGLDVPWPDYMVERFVPAGADLLAVLSNGQLLSARLDELAWRRILPEAGEVNAAAVVESGD